MVTTLAKEVSSKLVDLVDVSARGGSSWSDRTTARARLGSRVTGRAVLALVREVKPPFSPERVVEEFAALSAQLGHGPRFFAALVEERRLTAGTCSGGVQEEAQSTVQFVTCAREETDKEGAGRAPT